MGTVLDAAWEYEGKAERDGTRGKRVPARQHTVSYGRQSVGRGIEQVYPRRFPISIHRSTSSVNLEDRATSFRAVSTDNSAKRTRNNMQERKDSDANTYAEGRGFQSL